MSQENVETARRIAENFQAALERGHFHESLSVDAGLLDPDFEWVPAAQLTDTEHYRGYDGFQRFMEIWTEDFEDWSSEVEQFIDAGPDCVVAVVRQRATGKESGVPVEVEQGLLFDFEAGRVIRMRNFLDPADALKAAGLSE